MNKIEGIRIFMQLAETKEFQTAARNMNIPRDTAEKAIADLESCFGAMLFDYTGNKLKLTETGRAFYSQVRDILNKFDKTATIPIPRVSSQTSKDKQSTMPIALPTKHESR